MDMLEHHHWNLRGPAHHKCKQSSKQNRTRVFELTSANDATMLSTLL